MKLVPINELKDGDRLCQNVYRLDGRLVLAQGVYLTSQLIDGLIRMRIDKVYVDNSRPNEVSFKLDDVAALRLMALEVIKDAFQDVRSRGTFHSKEVIRRTEELTTQLVKKPELTIQMKEHRCEPTYLLAHSVSVYFLSIMTARALGYTEQHIRTLAIGALLHDIGYAIPGAANPAATHPKAGFELLRKQQEMPLLSAHIVLQHHEKLNGAGFPQGIEGGAFRQSAQICAIANDFDHFVNEIGKNRLPHEGIEYVMSKVDSSYDFDVVRAFVQAVTPYPIGTFVLLSNGQVGKVCANHKGQSSRPVIHIMHKNEQLDLLKHPTLFIKEVVFDQSAIAQ